MASEEPAPDGFCGVVAAQRELRMNRWQVVELHLRIFREALGQVIRQGLSPGRIPRQGQRQRRSVLDVPTGRKPERRRISLPGLDGIAEEGFPHR